MADRTVRAIFEAKVSGAQTGMRNLSTDVGKAGQQVDDLTKDLKALDGQKVSPDIDVEIAEAKRRLNDVQLEIADLKAMDASPEVDLQIAEAQRRASEIRQEIRDLNGQKAEVRIDAAIGDAEQRISQLKLDLGELRSTKATPEVTVQIAQAQKDLRDAKAELRELSSAKAEMKVTADTSQARGALDDLADDVGEAGAEGGDEAGSNIVQGILGALQTIPIAGAVVGVGAAIAGGLLLGIQQGLAIEAQRDLFSARTGLDEETSARFGRAAGEAYAAAWGDSVEANLDTARIALEQGLLDEDAIEADVEKVITALSGISTIMEEDIPSAARAAGQLIKTGLADNADEAFDIIVSGFQNGLSASDDFLDTIVEYSSQFAAVGLSAKDALGLISQGLDAGAFNADKVADAIKEMNLRISEGTPPAAEALEALGLSSEGIIAGFTEGGPRAVEAMGLVFDALRDLDERGGNTQEVIAALFGGPGEDLGAALFALDVNTAAEAVGGLEGSAGAAERALATMSDNASAQIESARRNIEEAANGIKGALAAAFSDEIEGAAQWVQANRAPLMQFFLDVINGVFDMGLAFVEFSAGAVEAMAGVLDALANILVFLPGFSAADKKAAQETAANWRETAESMRTDWGGALEDMQGKVNTWAAPELMKARINDATVVMTQDFDAFLERVNTADGTVTINGDQIPAEDVLDTLVANIDGSDGTVVINGDKVPADQALDTLLNLINSSEEDVTIGGDPTPGEAELEGLREMVRRAEDDIKINGDDAQGRAILEALRKKVAATEAAMKVRADTAQAEREITYLARGRTVTVRVVTQGSVGGGVPLHSGGWVAGRHEGGWVPGRDPGYDNVLWPLHSGGQVMTQPLTGGEYVVNSRDASYWAQALEAINAGYRPASTTGGSMRISGTLDLGGGVMGRVIGAVEMVEDFAGNAPMRSRMASGVR